MVRDEREGGSRREIEKARGEERGGLSCLKGRRRVIWERKWSRTPL